MAACTSTPLPGDPAVRKPALAIVLSLAHAALLLACTPASATQPCPDPNGCIDEAAATFLLITEFTEKFCAEADPPNAPLYKARLKQQLRDERPDYLERLRASQIYAFVKAEMEGKIPGSPKADPQFFLGECKQALPAGPQGPR